MFYFYGIACTNLFYFIVFEICLQNLYLYRHVRDLMYFLRLFVNRIVVQCLVKGREKYDLKRLITFTNGTHGIRSGFYDIHIQ